MKINQFANTCHGRITKIMLAAGLLLLPSALEANDSISPPVLQRLSGKQAFVYDFFPLPSVNPALKPFLYSDRLTEIRLESHYEHQTDAIAVQEGDGKRFSRMHVDSYIPLAGSALWGNASYSGGKRFHLKLNETSDPALLYPYLTGDTIGGNLQSEVYRFAGGYARHNAHFSWGIEAGFRAMQEYRAIDPRPRNIVSDLNLSLGGSISLPSGHAAAAALHFRKYKQKNEIDFYNELGDVKVYHYTGLGNDYARFRTKADQSHYNGNALGASLHLLPRQPNGAIASFKYSRFFFEKIISSLNELNMLDRTEQALEAEAGYRLKSSARAIAFRLSAVHLRKSGRENIFGDEASNNYPFIVVLEQYRRNIDRLEAAALCEYYRPALRWAVQPSAGYEADAERYTLPQREISRKHFTAALRLAFDKSGEKLSFQVGAALKHYFPVSSAIVLTGDEQENFSLPALRRNHEYLAGKRTALAIDGRLNYAFRRDYAVFLSLQWQQGRYIYDTTTNNITASAGINF
ncbi:MAG: hypothetical protein LBP98_09360 [Tannerella sp.]|jgi:hypothetical protein|nr:hypothetical protein [Tannerella sp.]